MIDWLSFSFPCHHRAPINGGQIISFDSDGEINWKTAKWSGIKGSHDSKISVRTATHTAEPCTYVEVSGNPVKLFQGHNLWGTDDLPGLAIETISHLVNVLDLTPTPPDRRAWELGNIGLTRVDVTDSYSLSSRSEVLAWLRAAEQTAHLSHRGRGQLLKGSTLYFGQHSRRWSMKLYAKAQEIEAKGHEQPAILDLPSARAWVDGILRAELTLRGMELRRLGLGDVADWGDCDGVPFEPLGLLRSRLGTMTMTTTRTLSDDVLNALTTGQRLAYFSWLSGVDLRLQMPRPSFYRLRSKLLPHGVDIATLQPTDASNVVPLVRVLEAVPAGVPDWAIGTPLYFEPRRLRAA